MMPKVVAFCRKLPKTSSGKIKKPDYAVGASSLSRSVVCVEGR
jgi:hypothetical protein